MNIRKTFFGRTIGAALMAAVTLVVAFGFNPQQAHATAAGRGAILYLITGQKGTSYSLYAGDSATDSIGVAKAWAGVKDSAYLMPGHISVVYAKYYYPAHLTSSGAFAWGKLKDSTGTVPGPGATAISSVSPTNGQLLVGRTSDHKFALHTLTGTSNQITVTNGAGTVTLSTPQSIGTASTPTFASQTLSATTNQMVLGTTRTVTISASQPASASRVYTIPDQGAAANFVMSAAAQTIAGVTTFSAGVPITPTTNQLILGTTRTVTISATQPATASRVYTIPDAGAAANFVMSQAAQTVAGVTTFSAGVPITATTNQLILGGASHLLTISNPAIAGSAQTYTIPDVGGAATFSLLYAPQSITGDGAITVPATARSIVSLSKGSAAAITIAAPTAGTDDGKEITVVATSAQAHVITCSTDGFNAKGSSGTVTFTAALGNSVVLVAYNGHWYAVVKTGVTVA